MKRWLYLSFVLLFFLFPQSSQARNHRFLDLSIEAHLGADGLVRVIEKHTVQFDGTFRGMFQWFDTSRGVQIRDVLVSEAGIPYRQQNGNEPGPAGTYFIRKEKNALYVDWSFEATDEIRTFELSYVLDQVVLKHQDVAEFYYQFVGNQWEEPRDHVRIMLSLPFGAQLEEIGAWGHGPLHGRVKIESSREIVWEVENLPAKTFVEGRVVFPTRLVPGATRVTNRTALDDILREEAGKAEEIQSLLKRKEIDPYVALILLGATSLFAFIFWKRFGKYNVQFKEKYYKQLPAKYSPAELAILYRHGVTSQDFTATLLDLARRGYLTIEEVSDNEGKGKTGEVNYVFIQKRISAATFQELLSHEQQALKLLFEDMSKGQVSLADFEVYVDENAESFMEFWTNWGKEVKEIAKKHNFYDQEYKKKVLKYLVPTVLLFLIAIPLFLLNMYFSGAICIAMGFVTSIVVLVAAERRSPKGHEELLKWNAFRRYLKEFSRVETVRVGSLGIWEEILPYAVTLGVADRLIKQLEVAFPSMEMDGQQFCSGWFIYYHAVGFNRINHMTTKINKSISTITIQSSGGGGGGGFSGGGGGGFGGGGGGVR